MNATERNLLIEMYANGYDEVMRALADATPAEMEAREGPSEWCPREIAHHLGDGEMSAAIRVRTLLAMDNPTIQDWDQDAFAAMLHYDRPIEPSLEAFRTAREATVPLLRQLSESDWQRGGTHTAFGPLTVETWLIWYGPHAHDHADQIRRARATAASVT